MFWCITNQPRNSKSWFLEFHRHVLGAMETMYLECARVCLKAGSATVTLRHLRGDDIVSVQDDPKQIWMMDGGPKQIQMMEVGYW